MPETTLIADGKKTLPPSPTAEGRDEMNLADFPISILASHQPKRIDGGKVDTVVYEATRFDPVTQRRVPQRVTLLTNSQIGLPTPTDENLVLGLLCLAKQASNFASPRVHFTPLALLSVLRWDPTGKNYDRLRDSFRRLKALTIRYENAWWNKNGRQYQSEFSTGIISEYHLTSQIRGRRPGAAMPESFAVFSPRFFESLQKGNLKRLDLDTLFSLKLPTSQRMYRFLDKRFYGSDTLEMDLQEFACGHIGLTPTENVAHIKQRLAPPIEELEGIGFLAKKDDNTRYQKLAPKIWRIQLEKGDGKTLPSANNESQTSEPTIAAIPEATAAKLRFPANEQLVRDFYRARFETEPLQVTAKELQLADTVLTKFGNPKATHLVEITADLLKTQWPEAKSFMAVASYVAEAEIQLARREKRLMRSEREREAEDQNRAEATKQAEFLATWRPKWEALIEAEKQAIRDRVLARQPSSIVKHPALVERFCLIELSKSAL